MADQSYDPTASMDEAIDAALALRDLNRTDSAVSTLMRLYIDGEISMDQCDAGEIVATLAKLANMPGGKPAGMVTYPFRPPASPEGSRSWGVATKQRSEVGRMLEAALAAIKTDRRRQAVTRLLVNREPVEDTLAQVAAGLADLAGHFWPTSARAIVRSGATGLNDATPERLAKAEETLVDKAGARWLVDGFERMFMRGQLDDDEDVNEILHAAGLRYAEEHFRAGMTPLGAIDYSRATVDGDGQLPMSERMEIFRQRYRAARAAMGERYAPVVEGVVIEGRTIRELGLEHTKYRDEKMAKAGAMERLNAGLRALAKFYHNPHAVAADQVKCRAWRKASARLRAAVPADLG